jgi:hypothetical protein
VYLKATRNPYTTEAAIYDISCQPSFGSEQNQVHDTRDSLARSFPTSVPSLKIKTKMTAKVKFKMINIE